MSLKELEGMAGDPRQKMLRLLNRVTWSTDDSQTFPETQTQAGIEGRTPVRADMTTGN